MYAKPHDPPPPYPFLSISRPQGHVQAVRAPTCDIKVQALFTGDKQLCKALDRRPFLGFFVQDTGD